MWGRVCLCQWRVCIFVIESVQKLYFCVSVVSVFSVCVCGYTCSFSVFHPSSWGSMLSGYSEGQRWHRGRGVSHHCHLSISPSLLSCILLSLFCGSWYVDFIKFSSEWVTEKTGGDEGSHPLFAAFICLSSFIPARELWSSGPRGEKVAQVPLPSLDTVLHNNSLIPLRSESGKEIF